MLTIVWAMWSLGFLVAGVICGTTGLIALVTAFAQVSRSPGNRGAGRAAAVVGAVVGSIAPPIFFLTQVLVVREAGRALQEFEVALPQATEVAIRISHVCVRFWWMMLSAVCLVPIAVFVLAAAFRRRWALIVSAVLSLGVTSCSRWWPWHCRCSI